MSIFDKIEEIRGESEHIRLRWAWGMTIIAMVAVVIIWMISFTAQKTEDNDDTRVNNELIQGLSDQKKSIEGVTNQIKNGLNN